MHADEQARTLLALPPEQDDSVQEPCCDNQVYLAVCVPLGAEVAVKLVDMEQLERAEEAAGGLVGSGSGFCWP